MVGLAAVKPPPLLRDLMSVSEASNGISLVHGVRCTLGLSFFSSFAVFELLPLLAIAVPFVVMYIIYHYRRWRYFRQLAKQGKKKPAKEELPVNMKWGHFRRMAKSASVILVFSVYMAVTRTTLSVFHIYPTAIGDPSNGLRFHLRPDFTVTTDTSSYDVSTRVLLLPSPLPLNSHSLLAS